jgi:hypothetical protein
MVADCIRGMPIASAVKAADATVPAVLMFSQRNCLTFTIQPPTPLLYLRFSGPDPNLSMLAVEEELCDKLFQDWKAVGRPVKPPETLLEGEVVPIALVVSRRQGHAVKNLWLATSNEDVAMLPGVPVGVHLCVLGWRAHRTSDVVHSVSHASVAQA